MQYPFPPNIEENNPESQFLIQLQELNGTLNFLNTDSFWILVSEALVQNALL